MLNIVLQFSNVVIVVCGAPGFCLAMCEDKSWQRLGVVLGVATVPAWWIIAFDSGQWGFLAMQSVYTVGWLIKLRSVCK